MQRKSIIEQVEEQEAKFKNQKKDERFFKIFGWLLLAAVVVGIFFIFKPSPKTEQDILNEQIAKEEEFIKNECISLIKSSLNFPSSFKYKGARKTHGNLSGQVYIDFVAKNAFGAELPQVGACGYSNSGYKMEIISIGNR